MSDAPVLGGFHRMEDFETADDFTKKHTPFIDATRDGDTVTVRVAVGHYVAHPNTADHFIDYIELLANHVPIARFDLSRSRSSRTSLQYSTSTRTRSSWPSRAAIFTGSGRQR